MPTILNLIPFDYFQRIWKGFFIITKSSLMKFLVEATRNNEHDQIPVKHIERFASKQIAAIIKKTT